jgi:hypothetical protein
LIENLRTITYYLKILVVIWCLLMQQDPISIFGFNHMYPSANDSWVLKSLFWQYGWFSCDHFELLHCPRWLVIILTFGGCVSSDLRFSAPILLYLSILHCYRLVHGTWSDLRTSIEGPRNVVWLRAIPALYKVLAWFLAGMR